ncbi:hypothetical protein L6164_006975 [Bauhinia variegata]|uniref:Uncharacterized protein n=1 Tax=Bauhinia variegata TaxID=167791 RepID=A0ACB9PVA5_BAUVA|nr:hypothetical protein L6164_006975 [Bauhinia variegata]
MASASASSPSLYSLLLISLLILASHFHASEAQARPPIVKGLSWTFYQSNCPNLETIVRNHLRNVFKVDIGQAPGLLGCDGSVLLNGTASNPGEKETRPNQTLRPEALKTIEVLRALIQQQCGRVVSCADITALAARDAVFLTGGPDFPVPLGRRDSLTFNVTETSNLPSPFSNTTVVLRQMGAKKFDATDVVALSGGHTFGRAHCGTFFRRVSPVQDPTIDQTLANNLRAICPNASSPNTADLDLRTPNLFDNKYYVDLLNRQGLFTSDQDLFTDPRTKPIVQSFALNQTLFFEKFANAMIKMSQLSVLTGNQGEIRSKCSVTNSKSLITSTVVEEVGEIAQF